MLCLGYPISYEGGRVGILVVCFNVLLTVSALLAPAPSLHLADIQVIRVGSIGAINFSCVFSQAHLVDRGRECCASWPLVHVVWVTLLQWGKCPWYTDRNVVL